MDTGQINSRTNNLKADSSKRALKVVTAILGLIPLLTGLLTLMGLDDPLYQTADLPSLPVLDSNLRFFGGLWFGLGLAVFWLVPRIEQQTALFRIVWGAIFLGGIGRLLSIIFAGMPPLPFVAFTLLEIVGAPLFIQWQHRVSQAATQNGAYPNPADPIFPTTAQHSR